MDDLITNWNRLTLSDREGPDCCLDDELSSQEFFLATKFLTKRAINVAVKEWLQGSQFG